MFANIVAIEYYLPKKILTNKNLEDQFISWSSKKIEEKTGIKQRHISSENETALDLALLAAEKLFKKYDKNKIDFVLFCTQSPEYKLPTTACIFQEKANLNRNIGALDFNLGCSGFVYGLSLAKGLIFANIAKSVLLITAETYSKYIHPLDKSNKTIFGDAAALTIIEACNTNNILNFSLGTDGNGFENLIIKRGASKFPNTFINDLSEKNSKNEYENYLYMDGPEIFNFTIDQIPSLLNNTLLINGIKIDDIDFFIFHQANKFILDYLMKKCNIPKDKFYINLEKTGNTVSASIPIALNDCIKSGLLFKNNKVMLLGFGVGYSWAGTIIII